jgi:hypothetical protein
MGFFDYDYIARTVDLLPPDKRYTRMVKWLYNLVTPLETDHARIFDDYKTGNDTYPVYFFSALYGKGAIVRYGEGLYISLINSNYFPPTEPTAWSVYSPSFIGVDERLKYTHEKIILEYALNRRYETTFRQPPDLPDIFIETNTPPYGPFIVGGTEVISSISYRLESTDYIIDGYSFAAFYSYTIYMPVAVFEAQGTNDVLREKTIREFVDKYNTIGLTYNIQTY